MSESLPSFSRSAVGGKKTSEVKARIADATKAELQKRCHQLGMTESEYIDYLLCISLYGIDQVIQKESDRIRGVAGMWSRMWNKVDPKT